MNESKRDQVLTVMSGLAILFVLMIHGCGSCLGYLYHSASYADADYLLRCINDLVTPAVPMFLFVSGYKYALHDRETPYGAFLKKRLPRVLMSFLIINTVCWMVDSIIWMERFDGILLLKTYISSWLGNTVAYPLWYIPMYCCVIIACPLLIRLLPNCWVRLALWLLIGVAQRSMAVSMTWLGEYPFMFVSYPLFFEMGNTACEKGYDGKLRSISGLFWVYPAVVAIISVFPTISTTPMAKYLLFSVLGVLAYYCLCSKLSGSRFFAKAGELSYPVFLLHEPVIGRLTGMGLQALGVRISGLYVLLWATIVLAVTVLLIRLLQWVKADRILWNFKVR